MHKFSEELFQFIWKHRLLRPGRLFTKSGLEIEIIKPGDLNLNSGPDFFNAQIKLNELLLAGNIELHLKTSDWLKHNHQLDGNYNNIILHVVYEHDLELDQNKNNNVEVLELKTAIDEKTIKAYEQMSANKHKLACSGQLKLVSDIPFISWMERMTIERLEEKVKRMEHLFRFYDGDYVQTFYTCLLRNFGFKVNALPFELIAKQLPASLLLKHADNLLQLEALLLGISGLLEDQFENAYIRNLQNEFHYLKNKYQLKPLKNELFKFSKLRPANFPTLRLAQFARLIHSNNRIISSPYSFESHEELMKILTVKTDGYWKTRYKMDGKEQDNDLSFGKSSAENVIINTFAPFLFFYSKKLGKPELGDRALGLLETCSAEINSKTKLFEVKKSLLSNAASSQAVVNLYDNYCIPRRCLNCGIAVSLLK
jgi:hypothetical protein